MSDAMRKQAMETLMLLLDDDKAQQAPARKPISKDSSVKAALVALEREHIEFGKYLCEGRGNTLVASDVEHHVQSMHEGPHCLIYYQGPADPLQRRLDYLAQRNAKL